MSHHDDTTDDAAGTDRAVIDAEGFTVRRTIRIHAPIAAVWAAITEPDQISRWFGDAVLDGRGVGATGSLSWPDSGEHPLRIEAVDPPRSIAYRWHADDVEPGAARSLDGPGTTVFEFRLEAEGDGTVLSVEETGFGGTSAPAANLESHRGGWNSELDELVAILAEAA